MVKRVVLVGAGGMGRTWAETLRRNPGVEIAGWADVTEGLAERSAERLGLSAPTGRDFLKMVREEAPDFVLDVTPPEVHRDVVVASLESGVAVLGEKPMASSMAQGREMVAASERSGKLYMVSQSRRYVAEIVAFERLVRGIGDLGMLNVDFYLGPHFGGFRDEMSSPLLLDMAIHTFDAARKISGRDAVRVSAHEWNPSWSWMRGAASAEVRFELEGGGVFHYRGSWVAEGLNTSWEGFWRAHGSQGGATWDGFQDLRCQRVVSAGGFFSKTQDVSPSVPSPFQGGIDGSLAEFLSALDTGAVPQGECHDNLRSLAMVFGAVESARRGETVDLAEILEG